MAYSFHLPNLLGHGERVHFFTSLVLARLMLDHMLGPHATRFGGLGWVGGVGLGCSNGSSWIDLPRAISINWPSVVVPSGAARA